MRKQGEEQAQGLLGPEQFDIDDIDSAELANGGAQSEDWSRNPRARTTGPARWSRRRYFVLGVVIVFALLVLGAAVNKGEHIKIPKPWSKKPPSTPDPPDPETLPDGPNHPKLPESATPLTTSASEKPSPTSESSTLSSLLSLATSASSTSSTPPSTSNVAGWEKPTNFKIIGYIFFGRPPVVAILDCYLKKNLVTNGGWLDEVHWVQNTDREEDIRYLDELIETSDRYKKITLRSFGYNEAWGKVKKEHMYIKIDDDIVYFSDNAIPDLVWSKQNHTDTLNVVANLINSPETGWLHYRLGAIRSYLPELKEPKDPKPESMGPTAWRASHLPEWHEDKMDWPIAGVMAGKEDDGSSLPPEVPGAPPWKGHRWLPLPENEKNLDKTPMRESSYDPNGRDWSSWSLGAQAHYSFLENLEKDQLDRYHYGFGADSDREAIWNMRYDRMNINFMAIWGKDVLDNLPFKTRDDELELSVTIPAKLRRPLVINTKAIAAHFSFRSQHEMYDTDLLDRYRAYANEFICAKDHQIPYQKITT